MVNQSREKKDKYYYTMCALEFKTEIAGDGKNEYWVQ